MADAGRGSATVAHLRDGSPVAAWLFKANPDVWDVLGFLRSGVAADAWRMARSYRVGLVRPGHPCALWVTAGTPPSDHVRGIWAIGEVTGDPYDDVGDPDDHRWRDPGARRQVRPFVPTRMDPLPAPIDRAVLADDPRWTRAEILRAPRMGSPVAIAPREWDAVLDHARFPLRRYE